MLLEWLLTPIFNFIAKGYELIRLNELNLPTWIDDTLNLVADAMMFFPIDVWVIVIANAVIWIVAQFTWAIFEWVYKKIPGID